MASNQNWTIELKKKIFTLISTKQGFLELPVWDRCKCNIHSQRIISKVKLKKVLGWKVSSIMTNTEYWVLSSIYWGRDTITLQLTRRRLRRMSATPVSRPMPSIYASNCRTTTTVNGIAMDGDLPTNRTVRSLLTMTLWSRTVHCLVHCFKWPYSHANDN